MGPEDEDEDSGGVIDWIRDKVEEVDNFFNETSDSGQDNQPYIDSD